MKNFKLALIGLGGRGEGLYRVSLKQRDYIEIVGLCDNYIDRCEYVANSIVENGGKKPPMYTDYKKCIDETKPDAIVIATSWTTHVEISIYAMEKGIPVACEVGGAYSLQSLWELVRCYEKTKTPIMFLENACYLRDRLLALNMKRLGIFGEIVYCEGQYRHDLREEICTGAEKRHYRLQQYIHRNADTYPTHDIGPISKLLDINCGNRFVSLYSAGSKSVGLEEYVKSRNIESLKGVKFNQSDVVTTIIKCANGETITITLDTTLPRFYSRGFIAEGTKGLISEDLKCVFLDEEHKDVKYPKIDDVRNNIDKYFEKYEHPLWQQSNLSTEGHGGADVLVFDQFFEALDQNKPMPIDVYDMATWMSITTLSEMSIATGQAVAFPDFTDGKWILNKNAFAL